MKKIINSKVIIKFIGLLFCFMIFAFTWLNRSIIINQLDMYKNNSISFTDFRENISTQLQSDLKGKSWFINLHGFYRRCIGQITNNDVFLLNNGMLTVETPKQSPEILSSQSEEVSKLYHHLEEQNIPFLYVQAPDKIDLKSELLPAGKSCFSNENATQFLNYLKEKDVPVLDLRPYTSATPEMVKKYFYNTDHHWNPLGGFIGYQKITEYAANIFPTKKFNENYLDLEQWNIHTKEDWFLGSRGKRVGIYFGGVDDLLWLTPKFDTQLTCTIPSTNEYYEGNFIDANIRAKFYKKEKPKYFSENPYSIYVGKLYPLVQHKNLNPSNDLDLLIINDSFSFPTQCFLSTQFETVTTIDLRRYKDKTLLQYIADTQPDMVIAMLYPGSIGNTVNFSYGFENNDQKTDS